jgi:DNA-binding transcriptional MocR family regulator
MVAALRRHFPPGTLSWQPITGGLYLWCRLTHGLDSRDLVQAATTAGVAFVAGDHFYPDGTGANELRLCFSGVDAPSIEEGVRRLGLLIEAADRRVASLDGVQPLV